MTRGASDTAEAFRYLMNTDADNLRLPLQAGSRCMTDTRPVRRSPSRSAWANQPGLLRALLARIKDSSAPGNQCGSGTAAGCTNPVGAGDKLSAAEPYASMKW